MAKQIDVGKIVRVRSNTPITPNFPPRRGTIMEIVGDNHLVVNVDGYPGCYRIEDIVEEEE